MVVLWSKLEEEKRKEIEREGKYVHTNRCFIASFRKPLYVIKPK